MLFRDVLYGEISLPEWIAPFLRLPEFVRLRGVRLSNIDSLQYKDFGSASRYDHAIGVVHLALQVASLRRLNQSETIHMVLAALLHDVGTPPFGHTLEIVFDDVDHELEAWNSLGLDTRGRDHGFNAFDGELPQFIRRCETMSASLGLSIRPDTIGELINGQGDLGYLIKGSIDLDNTDNVLRGAHYMGLPASGELAETIACWVATLDGPPAFDGELPSAARRWVEIRDEYYRLFYDCSDDEQGRQALLQFLIREAFRLGLPKERMLKTTDDGLIQTISDYAHQQGKRAEILSDAIYKYKWLEPIVKISELHFDSKELLDAFRVRTSIGWMEYDLRQPGLVPMLFYAKRRFPDRIKPPGSLFGYPDGRLSIFALYDPKHERPGKKNGKALPHPSEFYGKIVAYAYDKPWRTVTLRARHDIQESLKAWGQWSFIGSRNDPIHTYPSTFVHAIPTAFLKSLRLAGDTILDPFCGSGITGLAAAKAGCRAVCADVNEVALLISRVSTTHLTKEQRDRLRRIQQSDLSDSASYDPPTLNNLHKWHHAETIEQLTHIRAFIELADSEAERSYLKLCFSSILTSTTARRGKEHGWFADNTPLAKGETEPPFVDAYTLFLSRVKRNLRSLENVYSELERGGEPIEEALNKITVLRANVDSAGPEDYCLAPQSTGGIITSPPYLGMSDYSLGQRLSYAWLFPDYLARDFDDEVGARRRRFNPTKAFEDYMASIGRFAQLSKRVLRPGGFVAMVVGAPEANNFKDMNVLNSVDAAFLNQGFSLLWETWRPINWHRNHGYERLKTEKLTVFVKQ